MQTLRSFFLSGLLIVLVGCAADSAQSSSRLVKLDTQPSRDIDRARALNQRAVELLDKSDWTGAEKILKQAIAVDAEFGPAQNNLGVVYYNQSKLYPAAQQFLLASSLLPRDPEPRNGLGLVFESSDRFDDAIGYYDRARALEPGSYEYIGNSARAHVRRGDRSEEVEQMLRNIANNDPRADWSQWARSALHNLNRQATTGPVS